MFFGFSLIAGASECSTQRYTSIHIKGRIRLCGSKDSGEVVREPGGRGASQSRVIRFCRVQSYTCERCTNTHIPEAGKKWTATAPCNYALARAPCQLGQFVWYKSSQEVYCDTHSLCNAYQLLENCWSGFLEGLLPHVMLISLM